MVRRGLPAALFATLVFAGVYWVLRSRTGPAAKSPVVSTEASFSEPPRSAGVRPEPLVPPAEQPVVRALKPAPQPEPVPVPAPAVAAAKTDAPVAEAHVSAAEPQALKPPRGPKTSGAAAGKGPAAPRTEGSPANGAEARDAKVTRPTFLNKIETQDYGGRE